MGEHVENIKFRLDTQLSFMLSTFSPGFFVVYLLEGQPYQGFFTFLSILAYCAPPQVWKPIYGSRLLPYMYPAVHAPGLDFHFHG